MGVRGPSRKRESDAQRNSDSPFPADQRNLPLLFLPCGAARELLLGWGVVKYFATICFNSKIRAMATEATEEVKLVEMWLRKDPVRWVAGAMAGAFAGLVMIAAAMVILRILGMEAWTPIKVAAIPFLGSSALETGLVAKSLLTGFIVHEGLCIVLGIAYAHLTGTNSLGALLGVGLTWGAFSWVFINNLFSPSFRDVMVAQVPQGAAFFYCMIFGISLSSGAFFDRMLRGRSGG